MSVMEVIVKFFSANLCENRSVQTSAVAAAPPSLDREVREERTCKKRSVKAESRMKVSI